MMFHDLLIDRSAKAATNGRANDAHEQIYMLEATHKHTERYKADSNTRMDELAH